MSEADTAELVSLISGQERRSFPLEAFPGTALFSSAREDSGWVGDSGQRSFRRGRFDGECFTRVFPSDIRFTQRMRTRIL